MNHTTNTTAFFTTTNRRLEQFLFVHDIQHERWYKNPEGLTVWVYRNNEEVSHVVSEYMAIAARREARMHQ